MVKEEEEKEKGEDEDKETRAGRKQEGGRKAAAESGGLRGKGW